MYCKSSIISQHPKTATSERPAYSFIQEFVRCPFKKLTYRRPQPSHGETN